jgi:hypothetical protein
MYHTTGFTKAEITELCARIEARELSPRMRRWPPVLGLRNALTVTLTYLRRNRVQAEIAENYGVSQPPNWRASCPPLTAEDADRPPAGSFMADPVCGPPRRRAPMSRPVGVRLDGVTALRDAAGREGPW